MLTFSKTSLRRRLSQKVNSSSFGDELHLYDPEISMLSSFVQKEIV